MSATFTGDEILYAANGRIVSGGIGNEAGRLVWNLDDIQHGDWFVAMSRGAEDTHDQLSVALERGARGCIVNKQSRYSFTNRAATLIAVADTKVAILELANYWRHAVNPKVIVVVATIGRKAIINILEFLLKEMYRCHKAFEGNGLSCVSDVLEMPKNTQLLIAEVSGADRGDVARVGYRLGPDIAIIGKAYHPLPSFERTARTAALHCEILDTIREGGCAVVYDNNPAVKERAIRMLYGLRSVLFSEAPDTPFVPELRRLTEHIDFRDGQMPTEVDIWCAVKGAQSVGFSAVSQEEFILP
ncbi:MAG: hypothetical protein K2Y39_12345 [Candidatus Obscuribacterales bacterium]|nr:hypothetical protein [Candidatus Obscuribacterales bacterium]